MESRKSIIFIYFVICTTHLMQLINQTNKCTIYISTIFDIMLSTPTCFNVTASSSGSVRV